MTLAIAALATLLSGVFTSTSRASLSCPAPGASKHHESPLELLRRSQRAMRVPTDERVLRYRGAQGAEQNFQSDRWYPPYFSAFSSLEYWYSPETRVERVSSAMVFPGSGPSVRPQTVVSSKEAAFVVRDTTLVPAPPLATTTRLERALNPWAVVADWLQMASDVRVLGTCVYREYPRLVLALGHGANEARLFLDAKTWTPVKLERDEAHYLFGQVRVEYLWTTWIAVGSSNFPSSAVRLADGRTELTRTVGEASLMPADSVPSLSAPTVPPMPDLLPAFLRPDLPDTVRVDATTFLLSNRGYRHAVTLQRDTVWLFEATQGEARARGDSVWIGRLFPGRHPIAVVITDLAWPHIAGARFWMASGATLITHPIFAPFLRETLARRWTLSPDLLERRRSQIRIRIDTTLGSRASGAVRLSAIDGAASEGAVLGWVPSAGFLWGSDFVQTLSARSVYTDEVAAAVQRMGVTPTRVAAQHLPLASWSALLAVVGAPLDGK